MNELEFVRLGLQRYPAARETVDLFEDTIVKKMLAALNEMPWKHFQPARDGGQLQSGKSFGANERWVATFVVGSIPATHGMEKVWLSLGVYWNAPRRTSAGPVAASWCNLDKGVPVQLKDVSSRDPRLSVGPLFKKTERRLLLPLGDDFDPAETFPLLVTSLDDALGG